MNIGPFHFERPVVFAPMAGISDAPTRAVCMQWGADYAVSEMISSETRLWNSNKTRPRLVFGSHGGPRIVQIAGSAPEQLASAARAAEALGADLVDINMGCPAKKVLNRLAGSALLQDEALVERILRTVVAAVAVPVTLKTRTGWHPDHRNGVTIARMAEQAGIAALTIHGRTRACAFRGHAEYDTIARIKAAVSVPVIANGDITNGDEAREVLAQTGADGLMIGRAARGQPWLFAAIKAALAGEAFTVPARGRRVTTMIEHLGALHAHYGAARGLRIARKHVGWYLEHLGVSRAERSVFNQLECPDTQLDFLAALEVSGQLDAAA